jgi:inner membrane protein
MLAFGHTGLTLGLAVLLAGLTTTSRSSRNREVRVDALSSPSPQAAAETNCGQARRLSWVESLADYADLRLLLVGSLLPDIIDKPIGQFFFRETFSNGRIFSHTLVFLALITIVGLYLYRHSGRTWLLVLSFGTFTHLVFDQMWRAPHILLWPVYGFVFEKVDLTNWVPRIFHALFTDPQVYLPELAGAAILIWFAQSLVWRRRVFAFLKCGKV